VLTARKIAFHTLGCKLNFSETSSLARILQQEGFEKVAFETAADIYLINTCSVTENADKECRHIVRKALRHSPGAKVVVVGCYAQLKPEEITSIPGVSLVLGAKEKFRIADYLKLLPAKSTSQEAMIYSCDISEVSLFESSYSFGERTRAFLKVQDGCDYNCTYCTIPLARGKSRSDTISNVVLQAELLAEMGIKEIVLTGVNIGDFGMPGKNPTPEAVNDNSRQETFYQLIRALDDVAGIERFRISSIEPNLLKDEIISFVRESKKFMPHFHIPLQSGSDAILKKMKRRYLSAYYRERVIKIKSLMPHCCIGVDVITGFPGETEREFLETYRFLNDLDVSYLHVFSYSERDNTEAAGMPGIVSIPERQRRNKMFRILSEKKKRFFYEQHAGTIRSVLFEGKPKDGFVEGFTDNYIKIQMSSKDHAPGSISMVRLFEEQSHLETHSSQPVTASLI
jgi:threonylcarbamoyladenosine tRNA methylthiotransferase MtaB